MGLNLVLAFILSGFTLYYFMIRKKSQKSIEKFAKVCEKLDYEHQSAEQSENGESVRISKYRSKNENGSKYLTYLNEDCRTMYDVIPCGAKESINGNCVGNINSTRTGIDWLSFDVVLRRSKLFADGLLQLGLEPKSTFGIYSINSSEYTIAEYSCYRHSIIVIPIYETLGSNVCGFISQQAKLTAILCDNLNRVDSVLKNVKEFGTLKHIIVAQAGEDLSSFENLKTKVKSVGLTLYSMNDVENLGASNPQDDHPPKVDDLAVICYTSGTTDAPKGVMLTHENIVADFSGIQHHLTDYRLCASDTLISYLPLGHMFERVCEWGVLASGGRVGYFSGDIKKLSDDMKLIKPTMFPCVPRVLNKIYGRIMETASKSPIKSWLLNMAFEAKKKQLQNRVFDNNTLWDHLVFSKIRALLGGHVRLIPVGSAPLNQKVLEFLRCALGCHILEGYGQTECAAACAVTLIGDYSAGHVGVPLVNCSIKLVDVPDMGYFVAEGKGEVMIKGSIVFKGYYMDPKKTAETIDSDGWLQTGDIGKWNDNGSLQIIDRKKDIFKLAQGEYIAPAKIEDIYCQSPYILQIFVYGDSYKSCLVGIVVPNFPLVQELLRKKNPQLQLDFDDINVQRSSPEIKQCVLDELINVGKMSKLRSFEQVKDIYIYPEGFTIADGLLTPTLKNKRFALKQFFLKQIQQLYSKLE